ncbi:MAG: class I SAM-dependent methyltransferase [Gammaproteobacteria bacterium]|nr:MAG: class I SAM-dependent methyltransferase [Gammaproteobacteria bacterium]
MTELKDTVRSFWEQTSCGEIYAAGGDAQQCFEAQARARYAMEPFIFPFAQFPQGLNKDVLEIGVGMGADHVEWARCGPRSLAGIDLTDRAVKFTQARLSQFGLHSDVRVADAEHLPFPSSSFDIVYSWGVLHHTPDTSRAINEVWRVLRPGGSARVMIYHHPSLVGYMLWVRYALGAGRPSTSIREVYSHHLESPGTQAFSVLDALRLFGRFSKITASIQLSNGDLLEGEAGQRHKGHVLSAARLIRPRWLIRRAGRRLGLFLLIDAVKWHAVVHSWRPAMRGGSACLDRFPVGISGTA